MGGQRGSDFQRLTVRHPCRAERADQERFALIKQGTAGLSFSEPCCEAHLDQPSHQLWSEDQQRAALRLAIAMFGT